MLNIRHISDVIFSSLVTLVIQSTSTLQTTRPNRQQDKQMEKKIQHVMSVLKKTQKAK